MTGDGRRMTESVLHPLSSVLHFISMSNPVIRVENLSKAYRLGQIGTGTLSYDLNVWWAKMRGKPIFNNAERTFMDMMSKFDSQ